MIKVGLTGNRYSGKKTVAKYFKSLGVPVFDADVVMKFIINYNTQIFKKIKQEFGENISNLGLIDTQRFDSDVKMNKLIDLIEFDMWESYSRWLVKNSDAPYTIFKSSILFERNLKRSFDKTINVFCPAKVRSERYANDSIAGISKWTVLEIMKQEMDEYEKNVLSDFIIHNYDAISPIDNQVNFIHKDLIELDGSSKKKSDEFETILP
jgi:dephospho-CoA kinase